MSFTIPLGWAIAKVSNWWILINLFENEMWLTILLGWAMARDEAGWVDG